jgi:hypothetical protein
MRVRLFLAAGALTLLGTLALATTAGATRVDRVLATVLTGAAEVPGPGDVDGIGAAVITIDTDADRICWLLAVKRIQLPATAAHIHVGSSTVAGPVVVGLTAPNAFGISFGCTVNAVADAIAANPAGYYVNVHTVDFPAGAIRGQLG